MYCSDEDTAFARTSIFGKIFDRHQLTEFVKELSLFIMNPKGTLYLIPTPLGEQAGQTIPVYVIAVLHRLEVFIAERAKTARHFIKTTQPTKPFSALTFYELNKRTTPAERARFLDDAMNGKDVGLLSEAGCPGVADPGAAIVAMAHQKGIKVMPLVGPSSILLALMGSGMNGQGFSFHGYLSPKRPLLAKDLKRLERLSIQNRQTQIFIETPYRNTGLVEEAFKTLALSTRFCIAADLTTPDEYIQTHTIKTWKQLKLPELHKRPAIFLLSQ